MVKHHVFRRLAVLVAAAAGTCLAVGGNQLAGAPIVMEPCNAARLDQSWYQDPHPTLPDVYYLMNGLGYFLAVANSSLAANAGLVQYASSPNSTGQMWEIPQV